MCGRYALKATAGELIEHFKLLSCPDFAERYNIAPQSIITVIRQKPGTGRVGQLVRWGLIPSWAKDPSIGAKFNNARGETVAEKPAFRSSFAKHRCLIPANGFYEWQPVAGRKQPYYIHPTAPGDIFAFAGLLAYWPHGRHQTARRSFRPASLPPARIRSWRRYTTGCRPFWRPSSSTIGSTRATTIRPR